MRFPQLKFSKLPNGDFIIESQYISEDGSMTESTRDIGLLAHMSNGNWLFSPHHIAFDEEDLMQIMAKLKELKTQSLAGNQSDLQ